MTTKAIRLALCAAAFGAATANAEGTIPAGTSECDCQPPSIISRGARVCAPNLPATVRVKEENPQGMSVRLTAGGREIASGAFVRALGGGEAEFRLTPPSGGWLVGLTEGDLVAWDAAGNVARRQFWLLNAPKPTNAVAVAADGRYEQDGRRIFPLGIYHVATQYMHEVRQSGFDVVHSYNWEIDQDDAACRAYLDACWAADGLRAFVGFDRGYRTGSDGLRHDGLVQGNFAHVARRVGALADHPALFCWYLFDEPEVRKQFVSPALLAEMADLVRELDPYHPVAVSSLQRKYGPPMAAWRRAWDTHFTQAYWGGPAGVARRIAENRERLKNASPITLIASCCDLVQQNRKKKGIPFDFTKFSHDYDYLRACALLGVTEGCNGVLWWWFARERNDYCTAAHVPKGWGDLSRVVREIAEMRPLLNAPGSERSGHAGDPESPVVWWAKETGGGTAVIAINTSQKAQTVDVPVLGDAGKGLVFSRYEVKKLDIRK